MRTTITLDDEVLRLALDVAEPGIAVPELVRQALDTFIRVEAAKRLAALGGAAPNMLDIPRRDPADPEVAR